MDIQNETLTVKNLLVTLSRSAVWFLFIGLMAIVFSSGLDILFGAELTHPIWQRNYDWTPLVQDVFVVAVSGGVMYAAMPALARFRAQFKQEKRSLLLKRIELVNNES